MPGASTVSIAGLLVFGTLSSVLSKVVYQTQGEDFHGHLKLFRKPWITTALMFFAMAFCLPIGYIVEHRKARKQAGDAQQEPLLEVEETQKKKPATGLPKLSEVLLLSLPMSFDLCATLLMSVGLLYITASVYQMLRGAEILFSAIFAVAFLHRHLNRLHYGGIACCLAGITLVGASSLLSSSSGGEEDGAASASPGQVLIGMSLVVVAQAVQAAQVTMEDHVMKDVGFAPLQVVGYEGALGTFAMAAILLPLVQALPGKDGEGIHEDTLETWHLVTHSRPGWAIPGVLAANSLGLLLYNIAGMFVTEDLGAVSRTVFESARTLFVWLVDLALFYSPLGGGRLGEAWDRSSYLQAVGFAVLVAGTVIYGRGDDAEEAQHRSKLGEAGHSVHKSHKPLTFRHTHSIAAVPHRSARVNRWHRAAAAAAAAAFQEEGARHGAVHA